LQDSACLIALILLLVKILQSQLRSAIAIAC